MCPCKTLVELAVAALAPNLSVQEFLTYVEDLPTFIRYQFFRYLPNFHLREMEMAWEAAAKVKVPEPRDGFDPLAGDRFLFDRETQREWKTRVHVLQSDYLPNLLVSPWDTQERRRNPRHVFWENAFCILIRQWNQQQFGFVGDLLKNQKLIDNVVKVVALRSHEVCRGNIKIIMALRQLERLEVYSLKQNQNLCWKTMSHLVQQNCHLTELGLVYGSLGDREIAHIRTILMKTIRTVEERLDSCRITTLDLVWVEIQPEGYHQLVALVGEMPQLLQLSVTSSITRFDLKPLIKVALRVPALQRLFLERNKLEDDAFGELAKIQTRLALRHLRLNHNNVSVSTLQAICRATMCNVLNLERLELRDNLQIGDQGIYALTPMLASPVVDTARVLTHLDVSNCYFGHRSVTTLLVALGHNKTVKHLNVGYNFFDVGFGDILAKFLLTNDTITHLQADSVGLGLAGVSARLLTALESNLTLASLSLGTNQLTNDGATAIFGALLKRAQLKPFTLVDLSENWITLSGLAMIADIFERVTSGNATHAAGRDEVRWKRQRIDGFHNDQHSWFPHNTNSILIEELRLLRNNLNDFGEGEGDCATLMESIRYHVRHLKSNKRDK